MLPVSTLLSLIVIICTRRVKAQLQPTGPGPNETYTAGLNCTIAWVPDSSGTWTNVTIDLMSGSNNNMSLVTNVVSALDGTDDSLTPYSWLCPEVNPYSTIYFYQFTNGDDISTRSWTTRFTIASPLNETEPPANSQQPDGQSVPWGLGNLMSSKAVPNSRMNTTTSSSTSQSTTRLSSASGSASSLPGHKKKPHGHAADDDADSQSNQEDGEDSEEDGRDADDEERSESSERPASRTRHANTAAAKTAAAKTAAAKTAAARATAIEHTHPTPSSDSSDVEPSQEVIHDDVNRDDSSDPPDGEQAQAQPQSPLHGYKNSGAADAADSARASGCLCGLGTDHENSASGIRLDVSSIVSSIAPAVVIALVVLYL